MAVPKINGYADLTAIGQGGFAVVYRAQQTALNRPVAVKVLSGSVEQDAITRFERECAAIGSLSGHPHVVNVYDAGTTIEGSPYLAMEYLPRGSLADRVQAGGPLATSEILEIGVQLCDALQAAHAAGVLHRDIKPENVLVDASGQCKLADFGVAAVLEGTDARDTAPGRVLGTVLHVAPEVLEGARATVASDIYSLGSTLASLALGRAPFERSGEDTVIPLMMRVAREPLPDLRAAGLDDRATAAIEMAMAKRPEERFGSAAAFGNALQQIQRRVDLPVTPMRSEQPTIPPRAAASGADAVPDAPTVMAPALAPSTPREGTTPLPPASPAERRRGRRAWVAVLVVAAVAAAGVVGFALANRDDGAPAETTTTTSSTTTSSTTTTPSTSLPGDRYVTNTEAIAAAEKYKDLGLHVVSVDAYRGPSGLNALLATTPDGHVHVVFFYDGHLIGLDFVQPSLSLHVVDQTPDRITVGYDLYAAGQQPPSASPIGTKEIVFAWSTANGRLIPEGGPFPPTDPGVEGHR